MENRGKKIDTIQKGRKLPSSGGTVQPKNDMPTRNLSLKVIDNNISKRGFLWYLLFSIVFISVSAVSIYYGQWVVLFVTAVFALAILWHGQKNHSMTFEITQRSILINRREFLFQTISEYYFSMSGAEGAVNIVLRKKALPVLTYILPGGEKDLVLIREGLGDKIPETEPRQESITDILVRVLKL